MRVTESIPTEPVYTIELTKTELLTLYYALRPDALEEFFYGVKDLYATKREAVAAARGIEEILDNYT